jgi:hypothetical protein
MATTVAAKPFVAPSERLFGAAAAKNMNTESVFIFASIREGTGAARGQE